MFVYSDKSAPRGAGTGLVGGCVPVHSGIVLSPEKMSGILSYDMNAPVVHTQSGVLLCALAADALSHGLMYPPDPGEKTATVGGKMMAVITVPVMRPQVGTIRPGTFKYAPSGKHEYNVIREHIDFPVDAIRTEILEFRADDFDESLNIADADAAVFNYCDYGIVGDMDEICDMMIEKLSISEYNYTHQNKLSLIQSIRESFLFREFPPFQEQAFRFSPNPGRGR